MLVNHTNTLCDRVKRIRNFLFFAVDENLAFLAILHAKKDLHQRGLTGTVFTNQCMDFVLADTERNVTVGHKSIWIDFGNPLHSQYFFCHCAFTPLHSR